MSLRKNLTRREQHHILRVEENRKEVAVAGKIFLTGFTGFIKIKLVDPPQATTPKTSNDANQQKKGVGDHSAKRTSREQRRQTREREVSQMLKTTSADSDYGEEIRKAARLARFLWKLEVGHKQRRRFSQRGCGECQRKIASGMRARSS